MLLLLAACAFRPPAETPALVAAEGPVQTVPLPAGEPLRVALRAGSAHDPPGREGLAWVAAHAIAAAAGATVEVGPEIVVFTPAPDGANALAAALAAPPSDARVADAQSAALAALAGLDCRGLAARAWDAWVYAGHPYGHAPEGRSSVLPTLTTSEVAAFQQVRYVRSVAVVGVPSGVTVDTRAFESLPPRLSVSPVPAVRLPLPMARVLVVTAEDARCMVAGHPGSAEGVNPVVSALLDAPQAPVFAQRREPRRLVALPLPPEFDVRARVDAVLAGGWLPLWQASRVLAPEATIPASAALGDALLAQRAWPALAHPLTVGGGAPAADVTTAILAPPPLDTALSAWLTPADLRVVVVLPAADALVFESPAPAGVQAALSAQELLR
jgi:hypothetical protein